MPGRAMPLRAHQADDIIAITSHLQHTEQREEPTYMDIMYHLPTYQTMYQLRYMPCKKAAEPSHVERVPDISIIYRRCHDAKRCKNADVINGHRSSPVMQKEGKYNAISQAIISSDAMPPSDHTNAWPTARHVPLPACGRRLIDHSSIIIYRMSLSRFIYDTTFITYWHAIQATGQEKSKTTGRHPPTSATYHRHTISPHVRRRCDKMYRCRSYITANYLQQGLRHASPSRQHDRPNVN